MSGKRIIEGLKQVRAAPSGDPRRSSNMLVRRAAACAAGRADGTHRGPKGEVIRRFSSEAVLACNTPEPF